MSHEINTQIIEHFYQDLSYQLEDNDFSNNELFKLLEMLFRTEKGELICEDMEIGLKYRLNTVWRCLKDVNESLTDAKVYHAK